MNLAALFLGQRGFAQARALTFNPGNAAMPCGFIVRIYRDAAADAGGVIETPPFPTYAEARSFGLRQIEKGMAVVKICAPKKGKPSWCVKETFRRGAESNVNSGYEVLDDRCAGFRAAAG
jgi:hypothetical protein